MIVKCEKCQVAFNINDALIKPGGTKLRCSKCKHIFTVHPPQQQPPGVPRAQMRQQQAGMMAGGGVQQQHPVPAQGLPQSPSMPGQGIPHPPVSPGQGMPLHPSLSGPGMPMGGGDTLTIVDFSQEVFDTMGGAAERYEELGTIGKGGMGEVIRARDTQLLRKVAIKVLKKEAASAVALRFFIREAQITAQLDHPNIVPLYTVKPPKGEEKNVSFVMKLVKGKTLLDIISKARTFYGKDPKAKLPQEINQRSRIEHLIKACDGMSYAHRKQVVHRDLKPANIMVGDFGEVYVMDWGIAKMLKDEEQEEMTAQLTEIYTGAMKAGGTELFGAQPEGVVGTLSYMSPEQAKGRMDVGTASDIFSLGAVLYELVTLNPARTGDGKEKLRWAEEGHLNEIAHMIPERKIDPELKAIINKATEFDSEDRYPSVGSFAEDLRCFLRGDEVSEHPDNLPRKLIRWVGKHRQLTLIVLLSVLLISSGATIWGLYREKAAMKVAQVRESKLSNLQAQVAAQAHFIDSHFLRLEDLAINLANNAMYLVQHGPPNDELFYWISDFKNLESAPSDHQFSRLYGRPVSIEYPVVKTSPGVRKEDVAGLMQSLAPLRHHFKKTLLDSRPGFAALTNEEAFRLLTVHGVPITWAFIGLEVGVMYSYPGKGTYSPEYDPRVRPWYKLGANKKGVHWGNPYPDIQGLGLVLPCATSLYDDNNQFYGVLGMDVTFSDIIEDNLKREGAVGVLESFLLDDKGRIVVRSQLSDADVEEETSASSGLKLDPFHVEEVVDAILKNESGLREVEIENKPRTIVFYQMSSLKWYYVEEVDTSAIINSDK